MNNTDLNILQELTNEDIKVISESTDLEKLLIPIKGNSKLYAKYMSRLGRMSKESLLVKKNLPGIVYELYEKGDYNFLNFFAIEANHLKNEFIKWFHECMGENVEISNITYFSIADYKKLFDVILNKNGLNLDLEIFYLQIHMFHITVSDEMKKQLNVEWCHMRIVNDIKKKLKKEFEGELNKKTDEMKAKLVLEKDNYNKQLQVVNDEVEILKNQLKSKENIVLNLITEQNIIRKIVEQKENQIINNDEQRSILKNKIDELQLDNKNILEMIKDKSKKFFNELQTRWNKENQEQITQNEALRQQYTNYQKAVDNLQTEEKRLKSIISNWNGQIESYFNKLDTKIIEHKVESILFQQLNIKQNDSVQRITNISGLYIVHSGHKIAVDDLECCTDYDDYLEIMETNLSKIGLMKFKEVANNCFMAAITAGLNPLICGYGSQDVALALVAASFAEKSKIICIPASYSNIKELIAEINSAETDTVIINDAFGKMNEALILPILRENFRKKVIFTVESQDDLKFLPKYYWAYIQLLVIDKKKRLTNQVELKYANAHNLLNRNNCTEKGNKIVRQVLKHIGMESSYIIAREDLFNNLLENDMNNSEYEAWKTLLLSELSWIMSDEQKESLQILFESNEKKYPPKLTEYIGLNYEK